MLAHKRKITTKQKTKNKNKRQKEKGNKEKQIKTNMVQIHKVLSKFT